MRIQGEDPFPADAVSLRLQSRRRRFAVPVRTYSGRSIQFSMPYLVTVMASALSVLTVRITLKISGYRTRHLSETDREADEPPRLLIKRMDL